MPFTASFFYQEKTFRPARMASVAALTVLIASLAGCSGDKAPQFTAQEPATLPGKGVTVYAAGDIADCRKRPAQYTGAARTAELIETGLVRDKDAVILNLGDSTYPVGLLEEFQHCYEPTWGRFKKRTYPTPGNHEYYTPQAIGYYTYFGEAAGPGQRGYYSFTLGSWHVVSLNSYLKPTEHKAQLEWLRNDLERNQARCILAFWHHPRYSSGGHGSSERMAEAWAMLQEAGAELVLSSHDHGYERFAPQNASGQRDDKLGMRQFVVGTGGASLTPFRFRQSHSEISDNSTHGVLKLALKKTGYEWEYLPVKKGEFTDRGTALCR